MNAYPSNASKAAQQWVRPLVQNLHGYIPGEQPKIAGLVKLNTNENPYPPSPKVLKAVQAATNDRLRLYPNPSADSLRAALAKLHHCQPENIIVGNGSDELLALAVRAFVEPQITTDSSAQPVRRGSIEAKAQDRSTVQAFFPSYSLYPVLTEIHGARFNSVPLGPDFSLPSPAQLKSRKRSNPDAASWNFNAALSLVTTPNAPTGRAFPTSDLAALCQAQNGVVILDEAYVDFAQENALSLALQWPNTLVARTFSKAYCLCSLRVGYLVGHPVLIDALHRIRDSYNVNGLGQVAAVATLQDLPYYRAQFKKVVQTRERVARELSLLGFRVFPSQTNFLLVHPPGLPAQSWLEALRQRKILVRWFKQPEIAPYLRISIGSDPEMDRFMKAVKQILKTPPTHPT